MNSLVSALVLGFSLIASTLVEAKTFSVTLNAVDSQKYENATANVNYRTRVLTLSLQPRMPECPEGRMCIQVMPPAIQLSFKNVRSTQDACGVITSQSKGIVLVNGSSNSCEADAEEIASLIVKDSEGQSSFAAAKDLTVALEGATLRLNRASGDVNLSIGPATELFFSQAKTETSICGVVQTRTGVTFNETTQRFVTLLINDNRRNTCPTFAPLAAWDVVVSSSEDASFSETSVVEVEQLKTAE